MQPVHHKRGIRLLDEKVFGEIYKHNVEESELVLKTAKLWIESGDEGIKYANPLLYNKAHSAKCLPSMLSVHPSTSDTYSRLLHAFLLLTKETIAEVTWQNGNPPNLSGPRMIDPFPAQTAA